jgi:uncharacterized protein
VKRRTLIVLGSFWPLALMDIARAAPKIAANTVDFSAFAGTSAVTGPYLSARQRVLALLQSHYIPSAQALQTSADALLQSLSQPSTSWSAHQPFWVSTMLNWERLAAVAVGPLVERRSARTIDFWPTRPAQIERILSAGTESLTTLGQLESIGSTARGLPALEWLMWRRPANPNTQHYAKLLAQQVWNESSILLDGYRSLATAQRSEEQAASLYGDWFGQAVGGLDQLRIKKMVPETRGKDSSVWVRGVSGHTAAAWQAQLQGLQAFLVGSPTAQAARADWPVAGSLQGLLLGNDNLQSSRELQALTRAALRAGAQAQPGNTPSLNTAIQALTQLSQHLNGLADSVLNISMGFTDADGD